MFLLLDQIKNVVNVLMSITCTQNVNVLSTVLSATRAMSRSDVLSTQRKVQHDNHLTVMIKTLDLPRLPLKYNYKTRI